ncbi:unnamed protein product, partial [Didymodactylos carnosus]
MMNRRSTISLKNIPITKLQLPPRKRSQAQLKTSSESSFIPPSIMTDIEALQQTQSKQEITSKDSLNLTNELSGVLLQVSGQTHTILSAKDQPATNGLLSFNQP